MVMVDEGGMGTQVYGKGEWPVDPQKDRPILPERIWIDGCFDFFHHGHAGVMLQARQLGKELYVGIHSDEAILENKGPTVMNLKERVSAAEACRWATAVVPYAPYVTSLAWMSHYGCQYCVHGDDITSDSNGEDCYRYVKEAGRFKVVKRTPGISTTDLVGRMLLCTKSHFIKSLKNMLDGMEGPESDEDRAELGKKMAKRIRDYASDETGLAPGVDVYTFLAEPTDDGQSSKFHADPGFELFVKGKGPKESQRVVYVDGGFDLFSSGHIEFLRSVVKIEEQQAHVRGWYADHARKQRETLNGEDYGPTFVVAGVHDDEVINKWKRLNYPIMNIFERGLCVLQCKYVHSVIFGAPFEPTAAFLQSLPYDVPTVVYHGPTSFMPLDYDPYSDVKQLGIFQEVPSHDFQNVNAGQIVDRITKSRAMFEERQRAKGVKGVGEEAKKREELEAAKGREV